MPERSFPFGQVAASENALNGFATEITHGDRRVRANSEETLVVSRRHRRDELAFAGRQRTVVPHHSLRELEKMPRAGRVVGKEVAQIRLPVGLRRRVFEMRNEHVSRNVWWRAQENRDEPSILQDGVTSLFAEDLLTRGVASIRLRRDIIG
jgi:hypothetical protein